MFGRCECTREQVWARHAGGCTPNQKKRDQDGDHASQEGNRDGLIHSHSEKCAAAGRRDGWRPTVWMKVKQMISRQNSIEASSRPERVSSTAGFPWPSVCTGNYPVNSSFRQRPPSVASRATEIEQRHLTSDRGLSSTGCSPLFSVCLFVLSACACSPKVTVTSSSPTPITLHRGSFNKTHPSLSQRVELYSCACCSEVTVTSIYVTN